MAGYECVRDETRERRQHGPHAQQPHAAEDPVLQLCITPQLSISSVIAFSANTIIRCV